MMQLATEALKAKKTNVKNRQQSLTIKVDKSEAKCLNIRATQEWGKLNKHKQSLESLRLLPAEICL